jgi:transcriptional regulator with GAF, ATPase, and Fis domain
MSGMLQDATVSQTRKPRKKPPAAPRKKSDLTLAGDEAKWQTERDLLLQTLRAEKFNLTRTGKTLKMGSPTAVLHAIDRYELRDEYEKNRDKA